MMGGSAPPTPTHGTEACGADAETLDPVPDPFWAIEQMRNCHVVTLYCRTPLHTLNRIPR